MSCVDGGIIICRKIGRTLNFHVMLNFTLLCLLCRKKETDEMLKVECKLYKGSSVGGNGAAVTRMRVSWKAFCSIKCLEFGEVKN